MLYATKGRFDLAGRTYGKLTVEQQAGSNSEGRRLWLCRCICGQTRTVTRSMLIRGTATSCGCDAESSKSVGISLGQRFGRLVVVEKTVSRKWQNGKMRSQWICKCDCGNSKIALGKYLSKGATKSCGCLQPEPTEAERAQMRAKTITRLKAERPDLTGQVFGRWSVVCESPDTAKSNEWICACICGTRKPIAGNTLVNGWSRSCGCRTARTRENANYGTRLSHPLYATWTGIKARCSNPKYPNYKYYGERGIRMAEEWASDFLAFARYMESIGPKPGPEYSIDRIEVNGNYEPGNIRWATKSEQNKNKRTVGALEREKKELKRRLDTIIAEVLSLGVPATYGCFQPPLFDDAALQLRLFE